MEGAKLPSPDEDQVPVVAPPVTLPFSANGFVSQEDPPVPALTTGEGVTVTINLSFAGGHTPLLAVVSVIVPVPAAISPAEIV